MNLHNLITNSLSGPKWLWTNLYGRRYGPLGVHLYLFNRGTPPAMPNPWYRWSPRYNWQPYLWEASSIPPHNVPAALCGYTSRSQNRRLEVETLRSANRCERCADVARQRGILISTVSLADIQSDPEVAAIITEREAEWALRR